ncbi:MAG: hypothetical protein IAA85_06050 [Firmicutes bacterium]|nr:hypothetical protein [Candidatus Alectryobacillus merdavium]
MKKVKFLSFILAATSVLSSCASSDIFSLKDATNFEVKDIISIQFSESVFHSSAWYVSSDTYSYIDCDYIKVDFSIEDEFYPKNLTNEVNDNAYQLFVTFDSSDTQKNSELDFYISYTSLYMYFDGIDATYRSSDPMPSSFIKEMMRD